MDQRGFSWLCVQPTGLRSKFFAARAPAVIEKHLRKTLFRGLSNVQKRQPPLATFGPFQALTCGRTRLWLSQALCYGFPPWRTWFMGVWGWQGPQWLGSVRPFSPRLHNATSLARESFDSSMARIFALKMPTLAPLASDSEETVPVGQACPTKNSRRHDTQTSKSLPEYSKFMRCRAGEVLI